MSEPESYASVWDAIADTPEQAANLRARAELMQQIATRLKEHGWTQAEAASRCGMTQPVARPSTRMGEASGHFVTRIILGVCRDETGFFGGTGATGRA
jgi:predicted XRE-type DNA-binding protein